MNEITAERKIEIEQWLGREKRSRYFPKHPVANRLRFQRLGIQGLKDKPAQKKALQIKAAYEAELAGKEIVDDGPEETKEAKCCEACGGPKRGRGYSHTEICPRRTTKA